MAKRKKHTKKQPGTNPVRQVITDPGRQPMINPGRFIDPAQNRSVEIVEPKPNMVIPDIGDSMSVVPGYEMQARTVASRSILKRAASSNEDVEQLFRQYMQKLIDEKLMLKLSEIKKMDILDVTAFAVLPEDGYTIPRIPDASIEERAAIERLDWYSIVPCFEKGALKLNKFRYIVFEVREIDPENKSVTMRLYDYMRINGTWQTGVATTVNTVDFRTYDRNVDGKTGLPNAHHIIINHYEDQDFDDLYTLYDPKELGWTKSQWEFWMDVIVANSRNITRKLKDEYNTSQCEQLANMFIKVIARCNAMLEMNKPSRPVKKEGTAGKRTVKYEKGDTPERKIRNVGILKVQSQKVPRKPCMETVITYRTAKWPVRGFTRTYPSGKTAYIKPGVRHRKALADTGESTATTIRFKKKTIDRTTHEGQQGGN